MNIASSRIGGCAARIVPALCCLMAPLAALAELNNETLLGAAVRWRPAYNGSASQRADAVPVLRYFGQPWFVRSTQGVLEGGVRAQLAQGLNLGAQLAYEEGREPGESAFLRDHGVPRIGTGASVGAQLEWDGIIGPAPFTLLARARKHVESDRGAQVDLRASVGVFEGGRFRAGAYAQATWASAASASSFYSITPQQSAALRLPAFDAGSGWLFGSLGLLWAFDLAPNWSLVGTMEARRLQGDAAKSPLTERAANHYFTAGLAYRY